MINTITTILYILRNLSDINPEECSIVTLIISENTVNKFLQYPQHICKYEKGKGI